MPSKEEDLLSLATQVGELGASVASLQATIIDVTGKAASAQSTANQAIPREEAAESRARLVKSMLIVILVSAILSIVISVISTATLASKCFIHPPTHGSGRTLCNAIPGYDHAEKQGVVQQGLFLKLLEGVPRNQHSIRQQQHAIRVLFRHLHLPVPVFSPLVPPPSIPPGLGG